MIALSDPQTVAIISGAFGLVTAIVVAGLGLLARQNSKQHGDAAAERAADRIAREADKQAAIEARQQFAAQLNGRLENMHDDIQQTRELLVDHIGDHEAHQGPRRVA